ncbi:MAG TPA: hypothetical protein VGX25_17125, partial [Actinophytocola sp.]|uniref:hypothetical protein n=1 Tax=Actinophytocola sp. TaxID=1872138 RepID=UPI002DDDB9A0
GVVCAHRGAPTEAAARTPLGTVVLAAHPQGVAAHHSASLTVVIWPGEEAGTYLDPDRVRNVIEEGL